MTTIYLCGPIMGCTDAECKNWRESFKAHIYNPDNIWFAGWQTLDPMRRDYRGKTDENVNDIVELDKIDIMNSDVLLVNYDKPSVGTSMEVIYAFERGKIIVLWARPDVTISPWLLYHSHRTVHSMDEAIDTIKELTK